MGNYALFSGIGLADFSFYSHETYSSFSPYSGGLFRCPFAFSADISAYSG
jgi:hypothetical protein